MRDNAIGDRGALALARSPHADRLWLDLDGTFAESTVAALRERFGVRFCAGPFE